MHVGVHVGQCAAGCLRLRFDDGVAVAGVAPGAQVPSSPQEERQAHRVAAGLAVDFARRRSGIGAPLQRGRAVLEDERWARPHQRACASAEEQPGQQEQSHRTAFAVTRVHALSYRKRMLKNVLSARTSANWVAPDFALASATAAAYPPSPQATSPRTAWLQAVPST